MNRQVSKTGSMYIVYELKFIITHFAATSQSALTIVSTDEFEDSDLSDWT
jgi:hypothetical protein